MKQWIEWLEKHTNWQWVENRFEWHCINCRREAQPEDLVGWKIRYAEECGYIITIDWRNPEYSYDIESKNEDMLIYFKIGFKTYQEAFDSAWDKFMELKGE